MNYAVKSSKQHLHWKCIKYKLFEGVFALFADNKSFLLRRLKKLGD